MNEAAPTRPNHPASGPGDSAATGTLPAEAPAPASRFVRACLRQPVDRTPVWFLRQAGRYMPEYMAVRRHHSLLDICRTPEIAAEVTITAAERLGVDAAIIFADLLLPFTPMGLDFEFIAGEGPVVHTPVRSLAHVQALQTDRTDDLRYVADAIARVAHHFRSPRSGRARTDSTETSADDSGSQDTLGIIGFIGAPFTLASYMIEGGSSRNYIETKRLMYASAAPGLGTPTPGAPGLSPETWAPPHSPDPGAPSMTASPSWVGSSGEPIGPPGAPGLAPETWVPPHSPDATAWPLLMEKLVTVLIAYARQQVEAGADVIQIFDSWAGALSVADYTDFCLPATTTLVRAVQQMGVPVILFGVDTASLLPALRSTGADVIGLDWRIPLDEGWRALGHATAVQGNLDPITLFAPPDILHRRVHDVLAAAAGRPGHIFNLGHGIVPGTPVDNVIQVVQWVKQYTPTRSRTPPSPI